MSRSRLIAAALLLALIVAVLAGSFVLRAVGEYLVINDQLQAADVVHVLSGPDHRTDYAIRLAQQGYVQQLFFTGGWCPLIQGYHGQRARERAIAQGIPPEAIAIDDSTVTSTYDEALRLQAFLANSPVPIRSIMVVSDPYHMRRSEWAYAHVLGDDVNLLMAPVPFADSPYQRDWWADWGSTEMVLSEYAKLAYYYARYELSDGWLQALLASLDRR